MTACSEDVRLDGSSRVSTRSRRRPFVVVPLEPTTLPFAFSAFAAIPFAMLVFIPSGTRPCIHAYGTVPANEHVANVVRPPLPVPPPPPEPPPPPPEPPPPPPEPLPPPPVGGCVQFDAQVVSGARWKGAAS